MASATRAAVTTRCRSCRAVVVWALPVGGEVPVIFDAAPKEPAPGRWVLDDRGRCRRWQPMFDGYEIGTHEPHWVTCPDADGWRQRGFPQLLQEA